MGGIWLDQETEDQISIWLTRSLVLLSFFAHLILALFSDIRRHKGSGQRRNLVWVAYQVTEMAPTAALGKLFLDSASSEQRLFAFWVPFLLLHLGRPDNITAYALEDNKLTDRLVLGVIIELLGALYGAYKQRFMGGDWVLGTAFSIMYFLGFYKYGERAFALRAGSFDRIRSSNKNKPLGSFSTDHHGEHLDDEDALFDAHGLLGITKGAFCYYPVKKDSEDKFEASYSHREDVSKVVQMELSLMYDIMYTKATVIHTWGGYLIRIASPPLTATALLLFFFHSKQGQKGGDIIITYVLLIGTLLLDVRWLLRALGSTWTYAFLSKTWLDQAVCCRRGKWYRLRLFVVSLDPSRRLGYVKEPSSYRRWSGTIGQHNLFQKCTTDGTASRWREDSSKDLEDQDVAKRSLIDDISEVVLPAWVPKKTGYMALMDNYHGKRTLFKEATRLGPDFHQLILTWHIATNIFLCCSFPAKSDELKKRARELKIKIKVLSDYMMFLLIERPNMLPDDETRISTGEKYEQSRKDLEEIWRLDIRPKNSDDKTREESLASYLLNSSKDKFLENNTTLSQALKYAKVLQNMNSGQLLKKICKDEGLRQTDQDRLAVLVTEFGIYFREEYIACMPLVDLLVEIRDSWLRLLIFASIRCSSDTHARQLSLGGELTTIIWILTKHRNFITKRSA